MGYSVRALLAFTSSPPLPLCGDIYLYYSPRPYSDICLLEDGLDHLRSGGDSAGRQRATAHLEVWHEVEGALAGVALDTDRLELPAGHRSGEAMSVLGESNMR